MRIFPWTCAVCLVCSFVLWAFFFPCRYGLGELWLSEIRLVNYVFVALVSLAPGWAWVTRSADLPGEMRKKMLRKPIRGGIRALLAFLFSIFLFSGVALHSAWFIDDMWSGPSAEQGVVCVSFSSGIKLTSWGTTSKFSKPAAATLVHSYGFRERITFGLRGIGNWRTGLGARIVELCKSHRPFTLWRWPRTRVIAGVE